MNIYGWTVSGRRRSTWEGAVSSGARWLSA